MTGHFLNSKGSFLLTDNFDFGCVGRLKTLSVLGSALVGPLHQILGDITDDQRAILKDFSVEVRVQGHTICGKGELCTYTSCIEIVTKTCTCL